MKAPPFDYARPASLAAVFELLDAHGDNARLLAGGQTLLATLNMRLSEPALLVDINQVPELTGVSLGEQCLRIGALTRHTEIENHPLVAKHVPLLKLAVPHIAHRAIRNLGTIGGSLAYADPAAEWPACALALDATIIVQGSQGQRRIAAADFFVDVLTTSLQPGEVLVAVEFPLAAPNWRYGFDELARRHGDYAIAGLALAVRHDAGLLADVRLCFLGIGSTPLRARRTEALLTGRALDAAAITDAAAMLASELTGQLAPLPDLTNSSATKRHLATVLLRRLLARASA
ncbi:MAG: binding domain in molybdopterin dehydrogenase family protein [Paucimonas sp.]|nr:binding domain in molybdopterin dehydrogenase family protein [Paucimonas sp.]